MPPKRVNHRPSTFTYSSAESPWFLEKYPDKLTTVIGKLFVFAFTWAFGGTLKREDEHEDDMLMYSSFEPASLAKVTYDFDNLVHELFESSQIGEFWEGKVKVLPLEDIF